MKVVLLIKLWVWGLVAIRISSDIDTEIFKAFREFDKNGDVIDTSARIWWYQSQNCTVEALMV
jgi:hypothetical protein